MEAPAPWFRDTVIYAVQVRTFHDSDGDGVGDLRGVIEKLDYIERLGVGCIWLLPFFKGGGGDDGYDVVDHCDVDPRYGTLADFDELVSQAKRRGLRVMIDLIADHTSDQHPLVSRSRSLSLVPISRLLRVERTAPPRGRHRRLDLPRRGERRLDLERGRGRLLLPPLLSLRAEPQ